MADNLSIGQAVDQLGGNLKKFHEFNFGKPESFSQKSILPETSQSALDQLIQQYASQQQKGNQFDFAPIEAQARKDFSTKTLPTIANRLVGLNGRNSGSFNAHTAQAGKDLEMQLAQMRNQFSQQNLQNFMQLLGLNRQENIHRPETSGLIGGLIKAAPAVAGAYFGGPAGAAAGGAFGGSEGGGTTITSPGATQTPGGPTSQEQQAMLQQFMDFVNNYSNQNNQNAAGGFNGGNTQGTNFNGESQIQQLIRMLGTREGQFGQRNVASNQRLGAY